MLKAPFPWFGGKSRVAPLVWSYFGDVPNYCEPFAGSLAVLLGRETEPRVETVNDVDRYLSNFWRASIAFRVVLVGLTRCVDWKGKSDETHL
jgi:DNA adenine methylase